MNAVKARRFIPIVFYTGLPGLVSHLETNLVRVVEKSEGLPVILSTIQDILATGLPQLNRALNRHIEEIQRDYMWGFVADNWTTFRDSEDQISLAYLLARRLAMSLSGPGIEQLARELGYTGETPTQNDKVHPMQYYILPPIQGQPPRAGDLYQGKITGGTGYSILLTPSCDLVPSQEKAEWALLAFCEPLDGQPEFKNWKLKLSNPTTNTKEEKLLRSLLRNNPQGRQSGRFHFLPGVLTIPNLLMDLQRVTTIPRAELDTLEKIASLDSPFAEALLAQFARYFGRLGTPDLDVPAIIHRLKDEANNEEA